MRIGIPTAEIVRGRLLLSARGGGTVRPRGGRWRGKWYHQSSGGGGGVGGGHATESPADRLTAGGVAMRHIPPDQAVDLFWERLAAEAKAEAPATKRKKIKKVKKKRKDFRKRDADIVYARGAGDEDKVALLVSRGLNDRDGVPGHVYRCLVREHRERCERRRRGATETATAAKGEGEGDADDGRYGNGGEFKSSDDSYAESGTAEVESDSDDDEADPEDHPYRPACHDAHCVILQVTAALTESRPGLSSSTTLQLKTSAAAEALVFVELYDDVFAEIAEELSAVDEALMQKMAAFELGCGGTSRLRGEDISVEALEALLMLSGATCPGDKLDLCARFLDCVSSQFSSVQSWRDGEGSGRSNEGDGDGKADSSSVGGDKAAELRPAQAQDEAVRSRDGAAAADADSLLRMVCEHVLAAKAPRLNAEVAFLEEFARDERSLRGREAYSLVTLSAALRFLNESQDLGRDMFGGTGRQHGSH